MMSILEVAFQEMIFDSNLIMAIIAINMTIIGLTSLAETKRVIGVDYGKFLVRKYRVLKVVRIYELLIGFAVINVGSLLLMFIQNMEFRLAIFLLLVTSLMFAIYYFFAYIIAENPRVKRQIYEDEMSGLYYASNDFEHQEADIVTKMSGGSRTSKKLSSNVIHYFNTYNSDSQIAFENIFGPSSVLYDYSKKREARLWNKYGIKPYYYRKWAEGVYDMSYEFFQLFRASELQDKWALEILRLFDGDRSQHKFFLRGRLYNFSRLVTHVNLFGHQELLFRYKFLEYFTRHYVEATRITTEEWESLSMQDQEQLTNVDKYTFRQLSLFMFYDEESKRDEAFQKKAKQLMSDLLLNDQAILSSEDRAKAFVDTTMAAGTREIKEALTDVINLCLQKQQGADITLKVDVIKRYIQSYKEKDEQIIVELTPEDLFGEQIHTEV
ncbi:hypothetical protein LGQ02_19285 [Bacillus shivajii]|uniref:hypothetical protein n=1 Tax=Bacillus shivajii TaxID=1983719 RepID=UPI001CFA05AA|nr:hypothetical protein [Bacillus shivajii]UCZ52898.1 hypothetical protein LGQ02_19285 [Bacillus shivajii]